MIKYKKKIKIADSLTNGYQYFYDKNHPLASVNGIVYFHRHIVSIKVGRWILSDEHVHHMDGNKLNNSPENLQLVTKKEHSLIESIKRWGEKEIKKCKECGRTIESRRTRPSKSGLCRNCLNISSRKFNPTRDELEYLIWKMPMTQLKEIYGVSDKAIEKRCKILGIKKPPVGYWIKKINTNL